MNFGHAEFRGVAAAFAVIIPIAGDKNNLFDKILSEKPFGGV